MRPAIGDPDSGQLFRSIPIAMEESSMIDRSTQLGAVVRIILPLSDLSIFTSSILVVTPVNVRTVPRVSPAVQAASQPWDIQHTDR